MKYDLAIIGAGPGGYIAAERASAQGLKVVLFEKERLGGVCLNEGCIPSKAMLNAAKIFHQSTHGESFGVTVDNARFDLERLSAHKSGVMDTLRKGVAGLMKRGKVEVIEGAAQIQADRSIQVNGDRYEAEHILIATGSSPVIPPIPGADLDHVVDSSGVLAMEKLPNRVVIIGAGAIGCEFACFFGSIGIPVAVIEMLPEICPAVDPDIAKILRSELTRKNITFHVNARVESITERSVEFSTGDKMESVEGDLVLISTGRAPNVNGLGLESLHLDFDKGGIRIDERCATNVPGVWAIGDVTGRTWLAHAASRMGEVVVHNLTGRPDRIRYDTIAGVIYTQPEVATVGLTREEAEARGLSVRTGKLPLTVNGRFLAEHAGERGLTKLVVEAESGRLLGVHMIGGACSEMIFGAAAMIEAEFRTKELEDIVFPHPTASETIRDSLFTLQ
jgi:dihydrolipoamide dehydrogenase